MFIKQQRVPYTRKQSRYLTLMYTDVIGIDLSEFNIKVIALIRGAMFLN